VSVSFGDLGVPADLVAALAKRGITEPFDIQAATIPDALAGRDVCGRAPTGSGKTVAFGIPVVARIDRANKRQPTALILAPTRELTAQICKELEPLLATRRLSVCSVYGGVGYEGQRRALNRGVDVLVACPGRLADLLRQDALDLSKVQVVVVDEADRMADMGFLPEVRRLLDQTPDSRQTMLFSATLDGAIKVLTRDYQRDAVRHDVGAPEPDGRGAHHVFWRIDGPQRAGVLADVVPAAGPTIVFCRTRRGADRLTQQLEKTGVRASAIHGGRSQNQRDKALAMFKMGRVEALIATDVAARGIHVDGVACVVHYDVPEDGKAYLHRSGRTARAGEDGLVISFVGHGDTRTVSRMQKDLEIPAPMTPPDISAIAAMKGSARVRVAPNKPLEVVRSEGPSNGKSDGKTDTRSDRRPEGQSDRARRSQRSARPQRQGGERYNGDRSSAPARGSGRPSQGRPPSRRAS
jgi:superfamily II DNA/RNA helicase